MVGREPALHHLRTALALARQGQRQVVLVTGEAGIGKTTAHRSLYGGGERGARPRAGTRTVCRTVRAGGSLSTYAWRPSKPCVAPQKANGRGAAPSASADVACATPVAAQ